MICVIARRLVGAGLAIALVLVLQRVALAQQDAPALPGLVVGEVDRCINGAETPAAQVAVGTQGGSANIVRTDSNGQFTLPLAPGEYTIVATADDGTTASRQYVPVEVGETLDIGNLDLGGGAAGCGPDSDVTAPVLPTFTPTPTDVPAVAATPSPTAAPPAATPTPQPTPQPDATPGDG